METAKTTRTRLVVCGRVSRSCAVSIMAALLFAHGATAQIAPVTTCDTAGIGSVTLVADGPPVTIREVSTGRAGAENRAVPYCLVKVLVPQAVNIWVGLPMEGKWNGRLQSLGGGGYAGAERANGPFDVKWPPYAREGRRLWYGLTRGASLTGLAGPNPFAIAVNQPRYWVYYDPTWDWHVLDYDNYAAFFDLTVERVGPVIATDDPDLSRFRDRDSKLILWHGWADPLIMPEGTVDYYNRVVKKLGGGYEKTRNFARLFMAPGVGHCGGGAGPQPQNLFNALVNWVENDQAPETILASRTLPSGGLRTRPLCLYPEVAVWTGVGSTDDATNFVCKRDRDGGDDEEHRRKHDD